MITVQRTIEEEYGDLIESRYVEDGVGSCTIAKEIGCVPSTIRTILIKRGIRMRPSNYSIPRTPEVREKISKNNSCYWKGKKHSQETKDKISKSRKGKHTGEDNNFWKGGTSFEPYCQLFNEGFKERCREFWGRKCGISGITEEENGRRLDVHHINYDKKTCCNTTVPLFIPLSRGVHSKTNNDREYWEEVLTNYIMIWFDGECYISKGEI